MSRSFNASITVTTLMTSTLEKCAKELAIRCIEECSVRHGFDAKEEIKALGLENVILNRKEMGKKGKKKEKMKASLPFSKSCISDEGCQGLNYNHGLFTQCKGERIEGREYCKGCEEESATNETGKPNNGTVSDRLEKELYEFKDEKGRKPVHYMKYLEKVKTSKETVMEYANKNGITIDEEHLTVEVAKKEKKERAKKAATILSRGRPKKQSQVVEAENVSDLFAKLTMEAEAEANVVVAEANVVEENVVEENVVNVVEENVVHVVEETSELDEKNNYVLSVLEKDEKDKKKSNDKEAKKAAEKAEKEAKKAAEKEAKKAAEKAEKEAKKAADKDTKKSSEKDTKKGVEIVTNKEDENTKEKTVEEAPKKVTVKRIQIDGVEYLKSSANIIYNPETKEEVGIWDEKTSRMIPLPDEEEEEEEEEYED